jgi:hypothetical protein
MVTKHGKKLKKINKIFTYLIIENKDKCIWNIGVLQKKKVNFDFNWFHSMRGVYLRWCS